MEYTVTVKLEVTGEATEQDVQDYIESELGYGGGMSLDNPFINSDSDAELEINDIEVMQEY